MFFFVFFFQRNPGLVCVLKTLEFLESNFKALKVLEIGFWSMKVFDFILSKIEK